MTGDLRDHPFHRRYRQRSLFPREVAAAVEIDAPRELVWDVLTDLERYSEWNPFTAQVQSTLEVGDPVTLHVDMPDRSKSVRTEWINLVEPGRCICWGMEMGHPLLLVANRYQELEDVEPGVTRYRTVDRFSGLLVPLMMALYAEPMRKGFESVALGLKDRAEKMHSRGD